MFYVRVTTSDGDTAYANLHQAGAVLFRDATSTAAITFPALGEDYEPICIVVTDPNSLTLLRAFCDRLTRIAEVQAEPIFGLNAHTTAPTTRKEQ